MNFKIVLAVAWIACGVVDICQALAHLRCKEYEGSYMIPYVFYLTILYGLYKLISIGQ